jgi:uncharacterized protein (DUF302 family)
LPLFFEKLLLAGLAISLKPVAGTKLMQKDIAVSIELPLRLAIVDKDGETVMINQTTEDYCKYYQLENHPVLQKSELLFTALASELH